MSYRSFLRRLRDHVGTRRSQERPRKPARRRPRVEALEDRTLPSVTATVASPAVLTVGTVVNASKRLGNQHESTIAVNPLNPAQLCIISNVESANPGVFVTYSGDGGATWTGRLLGTGTGAGGDGFPAACCDPQAAWDQFGNLFLTYLDYNDDQVVVLRSTTGGQTFSIVGQFTDPGGSPDQPSIATGPAGPAGLGSVWVDWTDSGGNVEAAGATVNGLGQTGPFSTPQVLPNSNGGDFGGIAVGPAGQVLVTYQYGLNSGSGSDTIVVNEDPTGYGGTFGPAVTVTGTNMGGADTSDPAMSNNYGIDAEANLAWDHSGGPHNGRVYLVYTDAPDTSSSATTTYLRYSDDNGATWSKRLQVNDDQTVFSKFLPSISVDQSTGAVGVAWYDCRNDPGSGPGDTDGLPNTDAELYAAVSTDAGQTFAPNVCLNPHPSNSPDSEPPDYSGDRPLGYGDFNTSDFADGAFYRVWADNSDSTGDNPDGKLSKMDLYTARLAVAPETITVAPDPGNNTITVRLDPTGNYLDIYQNVPTTGTPTFIAAVQAVKNITVQGGPGNDLLVVDTSNGNPLPSGGLSFTGGGGVDSVTLQGGGAVGTEVYTGVGPGSGTVTLDGQPLTFSGVASYTDSAAATNFTVNGTPAGDTVNVVNAPSKVNGFAATEVNSGAGDTFLAVDFADKTNVTVSGAAGNDSVTLNNPTPAAGMTGLTIDGGGGNDQLNVQAAGVAPTARDLSGNDTINLSSDAPTDNGTLAGLAGLTLLVDVGGGGTDTLNISERGATAGDAVTVDTANHVINSTTLGWFVNTSGSAPFAGGIHLSLGSGGDTVNVNSTAAGEPVTVDGGARADTYNVSAAGIGSGGLALNDSGGDGAGDVYNINANNSPITLTTGGPGVLSYQVAGAGLVSQDDADDTFGISLANVPSDGLTLVTNGGGVADGQPDGTVIGQDGFGDFSLSLNDFGSVPFLNLLFPMAEVHQVEIGGTSDSESLLLDFSNGSPIPANNLFSYSPGTGGNTLTLQGGSFSAETDAPTGAEAGSYSVTDGGQTYSLTYANVIDITDTSPSAGLTIDGSTGPDAITVNNGPKVFTSDDPTGAVTTTVGSASFALVDAANKTTLAVAGQGGNDTITLSATTPGPGLATLAFTGGAGNDVVNIMDTAASYTTSIDGNGGNDTVDVGSTLAFPGGGLLSFVRGPVQVADTGGSATLDVDDGADKTGRTLTVSGSSVAVTGLTTVSYANVAALNVYAGAGSDTINVSGTSAATTTSVNAGGGSDSFHVGSGGTLDNILGTLSLDGGAVGANGNTATFDDSAQDTGHSYTLTATQFSRTGGPTVTYSNLARVGVNGGSAADSFDVTPAAATAFTINGGGPAAPPGDTLTYEGSGTLKLTGDRAGTVSAAGVKDVSYTDVETVGASGKLALQVNTTTLGVGGDTRPDAVLLQGAGSNFDVSVNGTFATAGVTAGYSSIAVTGSADADTLTVDLANGNPVPSGGVSFTGGGGSDALVLQGGGTITNEVYTPGALGSGTVTLDGAAVSFSGLSSYKDSATATNFTVNGTSTGEVINVVDAPAQVNGFAATEVNGGTSPTFLGVDFANKAQVTVSGQGGGDTFTVNNPNPAAGLAGLKAVGGAGGDSFTVTATGAVPVTLDGGAGADTYGVAAGGIGSGGVALDDSGSDGAGDGYNIDAGGNALTVTTGGPGVLSYQAAGAGLVSQDDADGTFGFSLANVPSDGLTLITNGGGVADGVADTTTVGQDGSGDFAASLSNGGTVPFLSLLFPMAEMHRVQVGGTADADTLLVDFSHGSPIPAGGFSYDGGGGSNSLALQGGSFTTSADTPGSPGTYSFDAASLTYANVAAITDTDAVTNFTVNGTAAAAALHVTDGPNGTTEVSSSTSATVDFANKVHVTLAGQAGNDTLTVNNPHPAAGLQSLALDGGAGNDSFDVTPSGTVAVSADGGAPATAPGDTLTYEGGGTVTPSGGGAAVVSGTGVQDVSYTGIETFQATGPLALRVSTVSLGVGNNSAADTVLLQGAGTNFNVSVNGTAIIGGTTAGYTSISVVGSADADTLAVDFTNGNPVPAGGLSYDGGAGSNALVLKGGSFASETITPSGPQSGSVTLGGAAITFQNTVALTDTATVTALTAYGTTGTDTINILDAPANPSLGGLVGTEINAGAGATFPAVDFANKTDVFVNGRGGGDAFAVNNPHPAAGLSALDAVGGAGSDTFTVTATGAATVFLDGGAGADTYTVTAPGVGAGGVALSDSGTDGAADRYVIDAAKKSLALATGAPGALSYQSAGAGVISQADADNSYSFGVPNIPNDGLTLFTNGGGVADGIADATAIYQDGSGNFAADLYNGGASPFLGLRFPMVQMHQVQVGGTADADTLVVDFTNGSPIPAGGFSYDGGGGSNALALQGGSFTNSAVTPGSPSSTYSFDAASLTYAHVATITDTDAVTNYTVNGTAAAAALAVTDGPGGTTQVSSSTSAAVDFANKAHVTVTGQAGNDTLTINNPHPAAGLLSLALQGGGGSDSFDVTPGGTVPISVDGGPPAAPPGDTLTYEGTGTETLTGIGAGTLSGTGVQDVSYTGIEAVNVSGKVALQAGMAALGAGTTPDAILLQGSGGTFSLSVNGQFVTGGATAGYSSIAVTGSTAADTLTVDFTNGNPVPSGGVSYYGNGGADVLALKGGSFAQETIAPASPSSGTVTLGNSTVAFTGVPTINDGAGATDLTIQGTAAAEPINVLDDPVPLFGARASQVTSGPAPTFPAVHFANKTNVAVQGVGGSDTFTLNNPHPAAGLAGLLLQGSDAGNAFRVKAAAVPTVLDGGGGSDTVTLHDDGNSFAGLTGALTVNAQGGPANVLNATNDDNFVLTDTGLTSVKAGVGVRLDGHFQTANLTAGRSADRFDVSGWHGSGTLDGSANLAGSDTVTATNADANFTLTDAALARTGGRGTMTLVGIGAANLTDTGGSHTFDVGGWTRAGTLTGDAGHTDTLNFRSLGDFGSFATVTLANGSLTSSDGTNLALVHLARANLAGGTGANAFDLGGWTGTGSVTGGGGNDTVTASKNTATFTLADTALTTGDGMAMALAGIGTARLTGTGAANNAFDVSGWHGNGSLSGGTGSNTVTATKDADLFTLTDGSLATGDGMSLTLSRIRTANLAGGQTPSNFDVSGWTGGGGLTGGSGSDTVTAGKDVSFTLADTGLRTTDGMSLALAGIPTADLTGGSSANAFDVSGWHGSGTLDGQGGTDTVVAASGADFTLDNGFLSRDGGFGTLGLRGVEFASLTNTGTPHGFDVGGWTHAVSLTGAGSDSVTATRDASFTLTDTSLTDTDGLAAGLSGITRAGLTGGAGANTFDVSGWSHTGSLTGGGSDTVTAGKDTATFTLSDTALATGDGMRMTLSGVGAAQLAGTGPTDTTFDVSGWTGKGGLAGGTGRNTVAAGKNASFTLADNNLATTDGMSLTLAGVRTADLTSGRPGNGFDVSGWTGDGRLVGGGGSDTVTAAKDANFVLSDTELRTGDGMDLALVAIGNAVLSGGTSDNAFDVSGWHGGGRLDGGGGTNTVVAAKDTGYVLRDAALATGDGMVLALARVQVADLTGGTGNNAFDVSGWGGGGKIDGGRGGADEVVAARDADFTLSDGSLTDSAGLHLALAHVGLAALTGGPGGNAFTVSGWSGTATLDGAGGPDSYDVTLSGSGGGIAVHDTGADGQDSLVVHGTGGGDITVQDNQVSQGAQTVAYTGVESVAVLAGGGVSRVTVLVADGFVSNLSVDLGSSPAGVLSVVDTTGGGVFHALPTGPTTGVIEAHYLDNVLSRIAYTVASGQVAVSPAAAPSFVQSLFYAIFGRVGAPEEVAPLVALLQNPRHAARARRQLVDRLEKSPDGRRHRVEVWAQTYLGRDATDFELAHYAGLLRSHTEEEVLARLLLGGGFLAQAGGTLAGLEALALRRLAGGPAGPSPVAPAGGGPAGAGLLARVVRFLKSPTFRMAALDAEYRRLFPAGSVAGPAEASFVPQAVRLDLHGLRVLLESSDIFYAAG